MLESFLRAEGITLLCAKYRSLVVPLVVVAAAVDHHAHAEMVEPLTGTVKPVLEVLANEATLARDSMCVTTADGSEHLLTVMGAHEDAYLEVQRFPETRFDITSLRNTSVSRTADGRYRGTEHASLAAGLTEMARRSSSVTLTTCARTDTGTRATRASLLVDSVRDQRMHMADSHQRQTTGRTVTTLA